MKCLQCTALTKLSLPPAFRRNGKGTVFTGVCLSTSREGGGVTKSGQWGYPIWPRGVSPSSWWRMVPHLATRGVSQSSWSEYPIRTGWGTSWLGLEGVPPSGLDEVQSCWDWMGVTPPPPRKQQQNEHLLHSGGMPLAFTQEDFLVWNCFSLSSIMYSLNNSRLSSGKKPYFARKYFPCSI